MSTSDRKQTSAFDHLTEPDYPALVTKLRAHATQVLGDLLNRMLDGADDFLFKFAEKAENNQMQQAYFDTMRLLRLERAGIVQRYSQGIRNALRPSSELNLSDLPDSEPEELDDLELIDQEAMEEMLALSNLVQKIEQIYREPLTHLHKRLDELHERTRQAFDRDALSPQNLCDVFSASLEPLGHAMDMQHRLVLYKLYDQQLSSGLHELYDGLNLQMAEAGLLSKISYKMKTLGGGVMPAHHADMGAAPPAGTQAAAPSGYSENAYQSWASAHPGSLDYQSWQALNRYIGTGAPPVGEGYYSAGDMLAGLSRLQQRSDEPSPEALHSALLEELGQLEGGGVTRRVSDNDSHVIQLVQNLFSSLLQQIPLVDAVNQLLNRLQLPLMKLVLQDRGFFTEPNHPARNLLDSLASTAVSINTADDELYDQLKSLVDDIAGEAEDSSRGFQRGVDRLNKLLHEEERRAREAERETQREVLRKHARVVVLGSLRDTLGPRKLPSSLHRLVLKHWATLLYRCYIKRGRNSPDWQRALEVLDELIVSVQPVREPLPEKDIELRAADWALVAASCRRLLRNSRLREEDIREGIEALRSVHAARISGLRDLAESRAAAEHHRVGDHLDLNLDLTCDPTACDNTLRDAAPAAAAETTAQTQEEARETCQGPLIIEDLEIPEDAEQATAEQTEAASETRQTADQHHPAETTFEEHLDPQMDEAVDALEGERAALDQLPDTVRPGNWFQLDMGEEHARRRLKLSVIIPDSGTLVFVDRRGRQAVEKQASELLAEINEGRSEVFMEFSAFDRALSSVISDLAAA